MIKDETTEENRMTKELDGNNKQVIRSILAATSHHSMGDVSSKVTKAKIKAALKKANLKYSDPEVARIFNTLTKSGRK